MRKDALTEYAQQAHAAAVSQYYQDEPQRSLPTQADTDEQTKRQDLDADSIIERRRIAKAHWRGVNE